MIEWWPLFLIVALVTVYWAGRRSGGNSGECQKHHWGEKSNVGTIRMTDIPIGNYLTTTNYEPWGSNPKKDFRDFSDWHSAPHKYYGVYEETAQTCVHDGCKETKTDWKPSIVIHEDELKGEN